MCPHTYVFLAKFGQRWRKTRNRHSAPPGKLRSRTKGIMGKIFMQSQSISDTELLYKISSDLDKWFRFYGNLNFSDFRVSGGYR